MKKSKALRLKVKWGKRWCREMRKARIQNMARDTYRNIVCSEFLRV